jgi:chromosome segregation ATPase
VVDALRTAKKNCSIYYPSVLPPNLASDDSELLKAINGIVADYAKLLLKIDAIAKLKAKGDAEVDKKAKAIAAAKEKASDLEDKVKELKDKLKEASAVDKPKIQAQIEKTAADLQAAKTAVTDAESAKKPWTDYVAALDAILKDFKQAKDGVDAFRESLIKPDGTGQTLLTGLLRAEKLRNVMKSGQTLQLKVDRATGSVLTKKSFLRSMKVYYSGGAIVRFSHFAVDGKLLTSGSYAYPVAFTRAVLP